ncbi:hypothetical protein [Pseudonocardia alaniniphila]|uniref:Peptidase C39-like protein n=1 Tax=Pseudonocardia alaniniphila TaxID=75291 RepID=A0ABS9TFJ1_9PSEU|nr:hypothetical protein [Pseudonocardia alaniniphila]MCH6167315.1 hypothetical protein [Pseudonocardia alaniniphila]
MRTVCGVARRIQSLVGRGMRKPGRVAQVLPLAGGRRPLLSEQVGEQRRGGVRLDQVDRTACGSAVLVALAAWADPGETQRLDGERVLGAVTGSVGVTTGVATGFGTRYDERQRQVHRETNRFWPRALGTTPWAMVRWLRRNVPGAGPYRVRLVDDTSAVDLASALDEASAALAAGRPVPMLVGSVVPRHYVMALGVQGPDSWRVYEPSLGRVRALDLRLVRQRRLAPVLGFHRLHALLLPPAGTGARGTGSTAARRLER